MQLNIVFYYTREKDIGVYKQSIVYPVQLPTKSQSAVVNELLQFSLQAFFSFKNKRCHVYIPDVFENRPTEYMLAQALKHTRDQIDREIELNKELLETEKLNKVFIRHRQERMFV